MHDYPAVILFHEICEEESSLRARLPLGQWRTWLHLIFDNIFDEPPLFIKLKLTPERLLFDVLAKSPEMKRGRYLNLYKIGLAMAACGFGDTVPNVENLRQYRYRATSQPRLYKRIVNKIYKRSFFNQINIENPHDSDYWLDKEMQAHLKKQQGRGIKDEYGTRQFRAIERIRKLERRSKLRSVHQTPLDSESPD